jgi:plastocyanin
MVTVNVKYIGDSTGNPSYELDFQSVGDQNTSYSAFTHMCGYGNIPNSHIMATEMFGGGSGEYNACWAVEAEDQGSLVMYVESSLQFNSDPVWFSLGNPTGVAPTPTEAVASSESTDSSAVVLNLSAIDIAYDRPEIRIPANTDVTLTVVNDGMLQHNFVIDNPSISTGELNGGESASITLNLPPGTYTFHCTVPGHTEAGQTGTLIVE